MMLRHGLSRHAMVLRCQRGDARRMMSRLKRRAPGRNTIRLGKTYAKLSEKHPFVTAGVTSAFVFFFADLFAQTLFPPPVLVAEEEGERDGKMVIKNPIVFDPWRSAGLMVFGFIYYGGPLKMVYFALDKYFKKNQAIQKAVVDVLLHTPFATIPAFYLITGLVRGKSLEEIYTQLKEEWSQAATGSVLFWLPVCFLNFKHVPQHSRVAVTASASFVHKTWLSWLSNRKAASAVLSKAGASG